MSHQRDINNSQDFLNLDGTNINLGASNVPFSYSISMGTEDVIFTIVNDVSNAWSNINANTKTWLGISHDRITGQRSFFTTLTPPTVSSVKPVTGTMNDYWFNTETNVPYLYANNRYTRSVCTIIGYVHNNQVFAVNNTTNFVGSTVGVTSETDGGHIITDYNMKPIIKPDSTFLTTSSPISTLTHVTSNVRIGSSGFLAVAGENIPKYHAVKLQDNGIVVLCNAIDSTSGLWGVVEQDVVVGETVRVMVEGFFETRTVAWTRPGAPLFIGDTGQLTEIQPPMSQIVGYTVSPTSFVIRSSGNIQRITSGQGEKGSTGEKGDIGSQGLIGEKGEKGEVGTFADHLRGFVTPEEFGAVGDGITDDTECLYQAHSSGNNVRGRSGAVYLIKRTNYIPVIDGRIYDYQFASILVPQDVQIDDTLGAFGRYSNHIFTRFSNSAMLQSIKVMNVITTVNASRVNLLGAPNTITIRDQHRGWLILSNCTYQGVGEASNLGGHGWETWIETVCGSVLYANGYLVSLEHVDTYDTGHAIIAIGSKSFIAKNVRNHFCGVSRDFTTWTNTAAILCRGSEVINITQSSCYVTGGTAYFLSQDQSAMVYEVFLDAVTLIGCGLSAIGSGTRNYNVTPAKIRSVTLNVDVFGFCCAIGATRHGGVRCTIDDAVGSSIGKVIINSYVDYLAPWETFNETNFDVDGSYNPLKKKGFDVGNQAGISLASTDSGQIEYCEVKGTIRNHQKLGLVIENIGNVTADILLYNNGWSKTENSETFDLQSSCYLGKIKQGHFNIKIDKNCYGITVPEQSFCSPLILRDIIDVTLNLDIRRRGVQVWPFRLVQNISPGSVFIERITHDSPYLSGGFDYTIDQSAGTYSKFTKITYVHDKLAVMTGAREIPVFTHSVFAPQTMFGDKTCNLLSSACYGDKPITFKTRDIYTMTLVPIIGETINGSTNPMILPLSSTVTIVPILGGWVTF